ncbi:hypothetical protein CC86DRAFT_465455 [Ophiobolus disseminans]|uniref:Uncharacterized protein n=1 Tax=Ophiobolus disseminans TaxID=1469910 RepID=A0A6A7A5X3_9PLEO|nr:hypothetical protein CC86DRAFT_465455 [Ophiobolus disseminans]
MNRNDEPLREAQGSSDQNRRPSRTLSYHQPGRAYVPPASQAAEAVRLQQPQSRPRRPSGMPDAPSRRGSAQPEARSRRTSELPQAPTRRPSSSTTHSNFEIFENGSDSIFRGNDQDTNSFSSEDWEVLDGHEDDGFPPTHPSLPPPSYDFPGTWTAAMHQTGSALGEIGTATRSFTSAVAQSGIHKAGWSVGSALLSTTNRGVLSLVSWAAERTGTGPDALPRPAAKWVKSGRERMDEASRARERRARRRLGLLEEAEEGGLRIETRDGGPIPGLTPVAQPVEEDEEEIGVGFLNEEALLEAQKVEDDGDDGLVRMFQFDD